MLDKWEDSIDLQDRNDVFIFIDWYMAPKGPSFLFRVDVAKLIFVPYDCVQLHFCSRAI
jgi:hypothetical protein